MSASSSVRHIFDIPDEILIEILLYTNARERAMLGDISERFNRLVFRDKKLLRDLDFSLEGRLTIASDIQQYFNDEEMRKYILRVNLSNVNCMEPGRMLNDYIGKALNLVDINIHGVVIEDLPQLGSFLKPLVHVKRLSVDWPITIDYDESDYEKASKLLDDPFSRLTSLSVRVYSYESLLVFVRTLNKIEELKELRVFQAEDAGAWDEFGWAHDGSSSLEIFEVCSKEIKNDFLKQEFHSQIPNLEEWTEFKPFDPFKQDYFYCERTVKVSEELVRGECIKEIEDCEEYDAGFRLDSEGLLKEVIRITCKGVPEEFNSSQFESKDRCGLKIEDAKLLLKNPRHQIKYLYLDESIGTECDVHLFALAAPSLTELYLSDVTKFKVTDSTTKLTDTQQQNDVMNRSSVDSSFGMLVKNTPEVRDLTLNGRSGKLEVDEAWDLGALCLIQGWKNLKSLRLLSLPICDGEFLIEIGKQCKGLEKLECYNLGPSSVCCYTKELSLMLTHCEHLTEFSMYANNIGVVSEVFVALAKNLHLRKVRLRSSGEMNNTVDLVTSIEQLLRRCSKLITFVCIIDGISQSLSDQLTSVLRRLRDELNRSALEFQVVRKSNESLAVNVDTVYEDTSLTSLIYTWDQSSYL